MSGLSSTPPSSSSSAPAALSSPSSSYCIWRASTLWTWPTGKGTIMPSLTSQSFLKQQLSCCCLPVSSPSSTPHSSSLQGGQRLRAMAPSSPLLYFWCSTHWPFSSTESSPFAAQSPSSTTGKVELE